MNQGGYFGAYRQGFKTLPDNAYQMMTAPTQQLASTITNLAGTAAGAYKGYQAAKAGTEAFKQGSAAQYQGLQSTSQATGVPMNPVLADQYMNIGQMSPEQQAVFQNSLGQEAQRMQMLYGINQAQARAAQAQQAQGMQRNVSAGLGTVPAPDPSRYGVGPAINMSGSLPLPVQNTGPRVNFPQYNYGQY
jgi:hypothetical protein